MGLNPFSTLNTNRVFSQYTPVGSKTNIVIFSQFFTYNTFLQYTPVGSSTNILPISADLDKNYKTVELIVYVSVNSGRIKAEEHLVRKTLPRVFLIRKISYSVNTSWVQSEHFGILLANFKIGLLQIVYLRSVDAGGV